MTCFHTTVWDSRFRSHSHSDGIYSSCQFTNDTLFRQLPLVLISIDACWGNILMTRIPCLDSDSPTWSDTTLPPSHTCVMCPLRPPLSLRL